MLSIGTSSPTGDITKSAVVAVLITIETATAEDFVLSLGGEDVPIDSNVVLYTGDLHSHLDIWDVYRTTPAL